MVLRPASGLVLLLACLTAQAADLGRPATGADPNYYRYADLMASDAVRDAEAKHVAFYLAGSPRPSFGEVARPDVYSGTGISLSPFGGSRRHCLEAFEKIVKSIAADAVERGYDSVIDVQTVVDGRPSGDTTGFRCSPGYKVTRVAVSVSLAMTPNAVERMRLEEERSVQPRRQPDPKLRVLALDPLLESAEARAVVGPSISAHAGIRAPAYRERFGPVTYSGEADLKGREPDEACRLAVLDALKAMAGDAREKGYDAIIKIRSRLDEQYSPVETAVECQVGRKTAEVEIQASLANLAR